MSNAFANGAPKSKTARPLPTMPQSIQAVATFLDNAIAEKRKPSAATLKDAKTAATGKPTLSTAMQALAVITGALASGTAAGIITYLMFPDGGPNKR